MKEGDYYPVKRKGERRRLRPNPGAIRYLEDATETDTEIESVERLGDQEEWAQMNGVRALGWYNAKRAGHYPRRMFDVFALETSSTYPVSYSKPCPACQDFSRTWACTEHYELPRRRQLPGRVQRPGSEVRPTAYCSPEPAPVDSYRRIAALPSYPIPLEIVGETVQGTNDAIRIEVESDGSTAR